MTALNEIEAVARAMYEARNKHLKNCYSWDDSELDNEHPDCRPSLYRDAKAAIAALDESRARDKGNGWKPIESAPKDWRTWIIGWSPRWARPAEVRWFENYRYKDDPVRRAYFTDSDEADWPEGYDSDEDFLRDQPTCWHSLPAPPAEIITPAPGQSVSARDRKEA